MLFRSSTSGTTAYLTNGTTGQVLTATTGGAPAWQSASGGGAEGYVLQVNGSNVSPSGNVDALGII